MINLKLTRKKKVYFCGSFMFSPGFKEVKLENIELMSLPPVKPVSFDRPGLKQYWEERLKAVKASDIYVLRDVNTCSNNEAIEIGVCLALGIKIYALGRPCATWVVSDSFLYFDHVSVLLDWINCEHTRIVSDPNSWEYSILSCKKCGWECGAS